VPDPKSFLPDARWLLRTLVILTRFVPWSLVVQKVLHEFSSK
jgi:hypothetical protein